MLIEEIAQAALETVRQMSPKEKAKLRLQLDGGEMNEELESLCGVAGSVANQVSGHSKVTLSASAAGVRAAKTRWFAAIAAMDGLCRHRIKIF